MSLSRPSPSAPLGPTPNPKPVVVFVSGHIVGVEAPFFLQHYAGELKRYAEQGAEFVVGDAEGIDRMAQEWLHTEAKTRNVTVYHMKNKPRHNVGGWKTEGKFKNDDERDGTMTVWSTVDLAVVDPKRRVFTPTHLEAFSTSDLRKILTSRKCVPPTPKAAFTIVDPLDDHGMSVAVRVTGTEKNLIRRILHRKDREWADARFSHVAPGDAKTVEEWMAAAKAAAKEDLDPTARAVLLSSPLEPDGVPEYIRSHIRDGVTRFQPEDSFATLREIGKGLAPPPTDLSLFSQEEKDRSWQLLTEAAARADPANTERLRNEAKKMMAEAGLTGLTKPTVEPIPPAIQPTKAVTVQSGNLIATVLSPPPPPHPPHFAAGRKAEAERATLVVEVKNDKFRETWKTKVTGGTSPPANPSKSEMSHATLPTVRNGDLSRLAQGLNIEGGFPRQDLHVAGRWVNVVTVLDHPFLHKMTFEELKAKKVQNKYPMLENAMDEIDEHRILVACMTLLGFYMAPEQKVETLVVQVHQAPEDAAFLIAWLKDASERLATFYKYRQYPLDRTPGTPYKSPKIEFCTDNPFYVRKPGTKADVLLSLSQCAGLDATIPAGALLVPSTFVPFDISSNLIRMDQSYTAVNALATDLPHILTSPCHQFAVDHVRTLYKSANPTKVHKAQALKASDFITGVKLLQVNDLWNPTSADETVRVCE